MRSFNAADWLVDRHVRDGSGARIAAVCADRTLTYEQLAEEVHRVAAGFRRLGVRPEERITFCMADGIDLLSGILAAMYIGAVPGPGSTMVTRDELTPMGGGARAPGPCGSRG